MSASPAWRRRWAAAGSSRASWPAWAVRGGVGLAGLAAAAAVGAGVLPGTAGSVAAEAAFVLTIPFMSTLLPYALGIGLLRRTTQHQPLGRSVVEASDYSR